MLFNVLNKARKVLAALTLVGALLSSSMVTKSAPASAPTQKKLQVPGYYRLPLGDFEVTALYDGYIFLDNKEIFKTVSEKEINKLLARAFITNNNVQTAVNAYLVNTGSNLILVDSGSAKCFGPTAGELQNTFRNSGYEPEDVDIVVITHLHGDHACGLVTADGKPFYPNATLRVAQAEYDFWFSDKNEEEAPQELKIFFKIARDSVKPYITANKFKAFTPKEALSPGAVTVPTVGHTPGHTSYQFSSKGETLLVLGDILHSHAVQMPRPSAGVYFDFDSKKAISIRSSLFAKAAKNKTWLAGAHLPFPGIGHVRAEGKGYVWVPVEYSPYVVKR